MSAETIYHPLFIVGLLAVATLFFVGFLRWLKSYESPDMAPDAPVTALRRQTLPSAAQKAVPPPPAAPAAPVRAPVVQPAIAPLRTITLPQLAAAIAPLPGIAILGPSRQGKTTLAEALIRLVDGELAIIDPKWRRLDPPKWAGLPAAHIAQGDGYAPIEARLKALWAAYEARIARGHAETNATFSPLWIVWDEINDTVAAIKDAGTYLRRWVQMGAEHGIRLIIMPQSDRVQSLGLEGHGDARRNVAWCYIGDDARTKARELVAAKQMPADQAEQLTASAWPALVEARGRWVVLDRSAAPELAALPVAADRAWREMPDETLSPADETPVSPLAEQAETTLETAETAFVSPEFLAIARLVRAGLVTETKAVSIGFQTSAGSSSKYTKARDALKRALEIVDQEDKSND